MKPPWVSRKEGGRKRGREEGREGGREEEREGGSYLIILKRSKLGKGIPRKGKVKATEQGRKEKVAESQKLEAA